MSLSSQVLDLIVGPPAVDTVHGSYQAPFNRNDYFSDDGPRRFDFDLRCWTVIDPEGEGDPRPVTVLPAGDGSGKFWEIWDNRTGHVLWVVEAIRFEVALAEKRRLCAGCGGRSGWARLVELP